MSLLLDTHVFIWWRTNDRRLSGAARRGIAEADRVFVSAASAWEVAIKASLGKLRLEEQFEAGVELSGFEKLHVTFPHAERVASLPFHHHDPFDRLLIAQAQVERLTVVSGDPWFAAYGVPLLQA